MKRRDFSSAPVHGARDAHPARWQSALATPPSARPAAPPLLSSSPEAGHLLRLDPKSAAGRRAGGQVRRSASSTVNRSERPTSPASSNAIRPHAIVRGIRHRRIFHKRVPAPDRHRQARRRRARYRPMVAPPRHDLPIPTSSWRDAFTNPLHRERRPRQHQSDRRPSAIRAPTPCHTRGRLVRTVWRDLADFRRARQPARSRYIAARLSNDFPASAHSCRPTP